MLLFEALDRVLPTEDADISKVAGRTLAKQNMTIHTGTMVENVQGGDEKVTFSFGDQSEAVDYFIIAAGRGPDVEGLGLDEAGVKLDDTGLIEVDGALRTSVKGVYAIGDLVPGRRSPTRPPTRASSPSRTPPAWRRTRSSTSTSRARRSARRTSARSG